MEFLPENEPFISIGLSAALFLVLPFSIYSIHKVQVRVRRHLVFYIKLAIAVLVLSVQTTYLILSLRKFPRTASTVAACFDAVGDLSILGLVSLHHHRAVKPSSYVFIYCLFKIATGILQLQAQPFQPYSEPAQCLLFTVVLSRAVLLLLESWPKRSFLITPDAFTPEETSGVFEKSLLWWINPLLIRGFKRTLYPADMLPLEEKLHAAEIKRRLNAVSHQGGLHFAWAIVFIMKWDIAATVPWRLVLVAFRYAQTFLISAAIRYLQLSAERRDRSNAYRLIGATALIYFGMAISTASYGARVSRLTVATRAAIVSLVYAKTLSRDDEVQQLSALTLMSSDVDAIARAVPRLLELWASLLELVVGVWLLWLQVGLVALAPLAVVLFCFATQTRIAKSAKRAQAVWMKSLQRRVAITSVLLRSIKSIKLSGMVDYVCNTLQEARISELKSARKFRWLQVWAKLLANTPTILSIFIVFFPFAIEQKSKRRNHLTASRAFVSLAILTLLTEPAKNTLTGIHIIAGAAGSLKRLRTFLSAQPPKSSRTCSSSNISQHAGEDSTRAEDLVIAAHDLVLFDTSSRQHGSSIAFESYPGSLTMILGPTGCGKSTLLHTLLGENEPRRGAVYAKYNTSGFCSQEPWLQNNSIRNNIIGHQPFDLDWYCRTLHTCVLTKDLKQLPSRDLTEIGSAAMLLSGGQKHRIALARALYSRCSILFLDDFISCLDPKTRRQIMHRLFTAQGHVRTYGCTVILTTHATEFARYADQLIVLEAGGLQSYTGPPEDAPGISCLSTGADEDHDAGSICSAAVMLDLIRLVDHEQTQTGRTEELSEKGDAATEVATIDRRKNLDTRKQHTEVAVWKYYLRTVGWIAFCMAIISIVLHVMGANMPRILLKVVSQRQYLPTTMFVAVFGLLVCVALLSLAVLTGIEIVHIGPKTGTQLHAVLLNRVFRAQITTIQSIDSSSLLNHFTQDMTAVEFNLPIEFFNLLRHVATFLMLLSLISYGSGYFALTSPLLILALCGIQRFYVRSSLQVRILEIEAKSPLLKQFMETMEGATTVRALGWQAASNDALLEKLDKSLRPVYLLACIQQWLILVLDLLVAASATILMTMALCVPNSASGRGGTLGVALTSVLAFNINLQWVVRCLTDTENHLGSISRIMSLEMNTPSEEESDGKLEPNAQWPQGSIRVSNCSFTYKDGSTGLKNVSFEIAAGQKIGICGRTGCGKSTLLSVFLRLLDLNHGKIEIDDVNLSHIPRKMVRERLICLPQNVLILPGSFRANIDPLGQINDIALFKSVLNTIGLWDLLETAGGLDADLDASKLSHGQQQLLALARAIIRNKLLDGHSILLCDEATSNLDLQTRELFERTVRTEFSHNTVITIAHNLEAIRDANMIIQLDGGSVTRIGPPSQILPLL